MEHLQREAATTKAAASHTADGLRQLVAEVEASKQGKSAWKDDLALLDTRLSDALRAVETVQLERHEKQQQLAATVDALKREVRTGLEAINHSHARLREIVDERRSASLPGRSAVKFADERPPSAESLGEWRGTPSASTPLVTPLIAQSTQPAPSAALLMGGMHTTPARVFRFGGDFTSPSSARLSMPPPTTPGARAEPRRGSP